MGNLTSQLPTIFWILKSMNLALNPSFWMIRAYLREASLESSSDLAPVTTILPDAKINAVVFGSRIRMITAAKRYRISTSPGERVKTYLGVILCISGVQGDGFQVETTIKVDCCNDISSQSLAHVQRQRLKGTYCRVGTMPDTPPVVTVSFSSAPFPFVAVVAVPFIPAPF
jgi:hypothetical protein